ncbi:Golgin-45 [Nymphon striatum]|nr:Golgin-45 [Nymphon striatum]
MSAPQHQNSFEESVRLPGKLVPERVIHIASVKVDKPKFVPFEPYKAAVHDIYHEQSESKNRVGLNKQNSNTPNITEVLKEAIIPFPLKIATSPSVSDNLSRSTSPLSPTMSRPLIRVNRRVRTYSGQVLDYEEIPGNISPCRAITANFSKLQPRSCHCWTEEKCHLQNEILKLKEDKAMIESQLQTQTRVNAELKKLLVASVGEDIQQRVQFLTEDKARLAEDVVNYSQRVINDYEEMERLSIQCDVWRSKYMASRTRKNGLQEGGHDSQTPVIYYTKLYCQFHRFATPFLILFKC